MERPTIAADATGALHVLWWGLTTQQPAGEPTVVIYSRWEDGVWTSPVDVHVGGTGSAQFPEALVDREGRLHVVWAGPQVMYSSVEVQQAHDANAWTPARDIGHGHIVPTAMGFATAPDGALHLLFMDGIETEVFHVGSTDGGRSWSEPHRVSTSLSETGASNPRLAIDHQGTLHAVWTPVKLPQGYPPQDVVYAASTDGGQTWSESTGLAEEFYGEATISARANGEVHIAFNAAAGIGGKFALFSRDGGLTWSRRLTVLSDIGGLDGHPNLAVDAADGLHYVAGGAGVWYSHWAGEGWSEPANLAELPRQNGDLPPYGYIEQPTIGLSLGSRVHVVFWDGRTRLWHTWRQTGAPTLPAATYPPTSERPADRPTETPEASPASAVNATEPQTDLSSAPVEDSPYAVLDPSLALALGLLPSMIVVAATVVLRLSRRHRHVNEG